MDINTVAGLLFSYLKEKDAFTFPTDFRKLDWKSIEGEDDTPEYELKAGVAATLEDLKKEEMFLSHENIDKNGDKIITYVIKNSNKNSPVSIEVSRQTAINLSQIINNFLPLLDVNITDRSDPDELGEGEMILLLQLVNFLAQRCQKQEEENTKREKEKKDNKNKEEPPEQEVV